MTYPQVHLPQSYSQILTSEPKLPVAPVAPVAPSKPSQPKTESSDVGCAIVLFLASLLLLLYAFSNTKFLLPAIALFILMLFYLMTSFSDRETPTQTFESYSAIYPGLLKKYNEELANYYKLIEQYETECIILRSSEYLLDYRQKQFVQNFYNVKRPVEADKTVRNGVSEKYLLTYLKEVFGSKVLINQMIEHNKGSFYPDFAILDNDFNLYIDLEIDEPYVGSTGEPIHHIGSSDHKRNQVITNLNWIVIRFAEEQVIEQPLECCFFIKNVLDQMKLLQNVETHLAKLKTVNVWSYDIASRMAFRRYRHSYLPINLQEILKYETFEEGNFLVDEKINEWKTNEPFIPKTEDYDDLPF